ncbi:hypothetical protein R3P38DRAFT_3515429, partial [Favolaschia claudopus]
RPRLGFDSVRALDTALGLLALHTPAIASESSASFLLSRWARRGRGRRVWAMMRLWAGKTKMRMREERKYGGEKGEQELTMPTLMEGKWKWDSAASVDVEYSQVRGCGRRGGDSVSTYSYGSEVEIPPTSVREYRDSLFASVVLSQTQVKGTCSPPPSPSLPPHHHQSPETPLRNGVQSSVDEEDRLLLSAAGASSAYSSSYSYPAPRSINRCMRPRTILHGRSTPDDALPSDRRRRNLSLSAILRFGGSDRSRCGRACSRTYPVASAGGWSAAG